MCKYVIPTPTRRVRFEAMDVDEQLAFVRQNDINVEQANFLVEPGNVTRCG